LDVAVDSSNINPLILAKINKINPLQLRLVMEKGGTQPGDVEIKHAIPAET
jgi:hypothetical protein